MTDVYILIGLISFAVISPAILIMGIMGFINLKETIIDWWRKLRR